MEDTRTEPRIEVEREGSSGWHWRAYFDGRMAEGWTAGSRQDARMHARRCVERVRAEAASDYIETRRL